VAGVGGPRAGGSTAQVGAMCEPVALGGRGIALARRPTGTLRSQCTATRASTILARSRVQWSHKCQPAAPWVPVEGPAGDALAHAPHL
jgi:hypothetical protein